MVFQGHSPWGSLWMKAAYQTEINAKHLSMTAQLNPHSLLKVGGYIFLVDLPRSAFFQDRMSTLFNPPSFQHSSLAHAKLRLFTALPSLDSRLQSGALVFLKGSNSKQKPHLLWESQFWISPFSNSIHRLSLSQINTLFTDPQITSMNPSVLQAGLFSIFWQSRCSCWQWGGGGGWSQLNGWEVWTHFRIFPSGFLTFISD